MKRRDFIKALPLVPTAAQGWVYIICGVVALGVGLYITYRIYKLCQEQLYPKPDKAPEPPPAVPNPIPPCDCNMPGCTCPKANVSMTDADTKYYNISDLGYVDPTTLMPVKVWFKGTIESSLDLVSWVSEATMEGWFSMSGFVLRVSQGALTYDTYLPFGGNAQVPIDLGSGMEPAKFFRLVSA